MATATTAGKRPAKRPAPDYKKIKELETEPLTPEPFAPIGPVTPATTARPYSGIEAIEPEWLWPGKIPFNEVTLIAGDGGIGKGFLMARLTKAVTVGEDMPDGSAGPPKGSVLLITSEDDPQTAMAWRLQAVDADREKVFDMTEDFLIPDSLPALRDAIHKIGDVRLVIIDPLSDVSKIALTSSNVRVRREVLNPLRRLARAEGVAIVVIHHTVKTGRIAGTKGITDAARQVLRVSRSPVDDRIRLIHVEKSNIASDSAADVAYTITGKFPDVMARFLTAVPDQSVPEKEPSVGDMVQAYMAEKSKAGTVTVDAQEMANDLGVEYQAVRTALTRLKQKGLVINPAKRQWGLAPVRELPIAQMGDRGPAFGPASPVTSYTVTLSVRGAMLATVKSTWQCARAVCPPWLLAMIGIFAMIPLDPFDEIVPLIPVLYFLWRHPEARAAARASWCCIWYEGLEVRQDGD